MTIILLLLFIVTVTVLQFLSLLAFFFYAIATQDGADIPGPFLICVVNTCLLYANLSNLCAILVNF